MSVGLGKVDISCSWGPCSEDKVLSIWLSREVALGLHLLSGPACVFTRPLTGSSPQAAKNVAGTHRDLTPCDKGRNL